MVECPQHTSEVMTMLPSSEAHDIRGEHMTGHLPETNHRNPLPKTGAGALCRQWVRCGRPACRCASGTLHGPYHYLFWREGGRLRKRYLPAPAVAAVRSALSALRVERDEERARARAAREQWRDLVKVVREGERHAHAE